MRLRPKVIIAAAVILATAGVTVQGRQRSAPQGAREQAKPAPPSKAGPVAAAVPDMAANRVLARQQLALIDQALATLYQQAQNARVSAADPSFSLWGRRRLETLRKAGAGKAEIVAALEKDLGSMKMLEAMAIARQQAARGTELEVLDVRFRLMEAEIWLNEEKAR